MFHIIKVYPNSTQQYPKIKREVLIQKFHALIKSDLSPSSRNKRLKINLLLGKNHRTEFIVTNLVTETCATCFSLCVGS